MTTSHPKNNMEGSQSWTHHKVAIPSNEIVTQMWYGYCEPNMVPTFLINLQSSLKLRLLFYINQLKDKKSEDC